MKHQRGVALIMVLLVVALVTVVCAGLVVRQQLAIRSTGNQLLVRQAFYYAQGGESLAQAILKRDLRQGNRQAAVDHLREAWAVPLLTFPLDNGGELHVRIVDLTGRFNLNTLAAEGQAGQVALQRFRRLLLVLELNPLYADRLQDWVDQDQDPFGSAGAEDAQYLLLKPPYRTGPGEIMDVSELRLLMGMSESDYRRLRPFVTALPMQAGLNVNTASAQVLASLADGLTPKMLEGVIAGRGESGYRDIGTFLQQLGGAADEEGLAVGSEYFQATTEVDLGDRHQVLVSYLQRGTNGTVRVLGRDLGQDELMPLPDPDKESER
ncbi:type II secretion system minor pseudopilin GspK [Pseudomonas sp. LRF_L74]|uniref:type II secretion system minor pseudopilin GspK n=1 Tax=Pseudomonas sp. LRF_L74 TaxID=3369422 RepID=UPI003F5E8F23